jgi:hypothetical protein
MDRRFSFDGAIPQTIDLLTPQVNAMKAIGYLAQMCIGTQTIVDGLACIPTQPASLSVVISQGSLLAQETVDSSSFGDLAQDNNPLMKMGINAESSTTFMLTPPTETGFSVNYLIEAEFLEADGSPVVYPYFNAADPADPFSGPNDSGAAQNQTRAQTVNLTLKQGTPAPAGTQTTPAVDVGQTGLYVITVNNGQSTITADDIITFPGAPFLSAKLPTLTWSNTLWTDSGAQNALAITLGPAPATLTLVAGVPLSITPKFSNTGATTLDVNGLEAVSLVNPDGSALTAGQILAGGLIVVVFDGTEHFWLVGGSAAPITGRKLHTSRYILSGSTLLVSVNGGALAAAASDIYTPSPGTMSVVVYAQGGGGGGAGAPAAGSGNCAAGIPGNGGSFGKGIYFSGFDGAAITIGAGGIAGVANVNDGGNGGTTSFGVLISCPGGPGGEQGSVDAGGASGGNGNPSGLPSGANLEEKQGGLASLSFGLASVSVADSGNGGNAGDGGGGAPAPTANSNGQAAESPGSGASGTFGQNNTGTLNGAAGASGYLIIEDYT